MPCTCNNEVSSDVRLRVLQRDPTRTTMLRNAFVRDVTKRFKTVRRNIITSLIANDALGLKTAKSGSSVRLSLKTNEPLPAKAFQFKTDAEKVEGFIKWLTAQTDFEVLGLPPATEKTLANSSQWMNTYIDSSFRKGLRRGQTEIAKAKLNPFSPQSVPEGAVGGTPQAVAFSVDTAFAAPVNAQSVQLIYTRAFQDLKGISDVMSQQISRVLATGLTEGRGPAYIARQIVDRVDKIGITRAKTLARTEVIRAHHTAMINRYEEAQILGVTVKAEWSTAGDDRVCPDCFWLDGELFTLKEVATLIPLHPNCRCIALPANVGEDPRFIDFDTSAIGPQYRDKKGRVTRKGLYEKKTGKSKRNPKAPKAGVKRKAKPFKEPEAKNYKEVQKIKKRRTK